ncbi:MAG: serine/threonine-protein kinase, partial [Gemmatimonadota bacterium]
MTRISQPEWAILSGLLDQALELPAGPRAAWLAEQRIQQPVIIAQLERLLNLEAVLDRDDFLGAGQAPLPPSTSTLAGTTLGAYLLERPLGQGGMGSVWLARRNDGRFQGVAAIKFLSLAVAGPAGEARFRREGSVLARLTHPNIARLLDAGVTQAGQPYLVLEYVDGLPLDAWCDARQLSVEGRLMLFQQVLAAVAHAHASFIVHRDLKPANILVTDDGTVKLLDFGIAKLLDDGSEPAAALTGSHEAVLTYRYAAPEQVRGDAITAATDTYSLGVVLYELLAGRHPTSGESHTPAEHVVSILDTDPGQLSRAVAPGATLTKEDARRVAAARDASPEHLRRMFAGDLDNILAQALRKDPSARYPTVRAFADDLAHYQAHEPVSARGDAWGYRAGKFIRRHRIAVVSAALVLVVLIVATVTTALQAREARRQRDEALLQARRAEAVGELQNFLSSQIGDRPLTLQEVLERELRVLEHFQSDPGTLALMYMQIADRYGELGDNRQELLVQRQADSLVQLTHSPDAIAGSACQMVSVFASDGESDSAALYLAAARRTLAGIAVPRPRLRASCLQSASSLALITSHPDSAVALAAEATRLLESDGATTTLQYASTLQSLADGQEGSGRVRESVATMARLAELMQKEGRGETIGALSVLDDEANALLELGEVARADSLLRDGMRRSAQMDTVDRMQPVMALIYGNTSLLMGRLDSAQVLYRSIARQAQRLGRSDLEQRAWYGATRAASLAGRLPDARQALEIHRKVNASLPRRRVRDDLILEALLRIAEKNPRLGLQNLDSVLHLDGYFRGPPKAASRPILVSAATAALAIDEPQRALGFARSAHALAVLDSLTTTRSGFVGEASLLEGQALLALHDTTAALAAFRAALAPLNQGFGPEDSRTHQARALLAS